MPIATIIDELDPVDLGLPSKFTHFRQIQRESVEFGLYGARGKSDRRFVAMGMPTGSGKSLAAQTIGVMAGCRFATITATLGLQDQNKDDFEESGLVDIRGKSNYDCILSDNKTRIKCDVGEEEHNCPEAGSPGCPYFDQVELARDAKSIGTNYQYWMHARAYTQQALTQLAGGTIDLGIFDEAHLAVDNLARFLGAWISIQDIGFFGQKRGRAKLHSLRSDWAVVDAEWIQILDQMDLQVMVQMGKIKDDVDAKSDAHAYRLSSEFRRLSKLRETIGRLTIYGGDGNWLWQQTKNGIKFDCIWPYRYAERFLFGGLKQVVLISATLRPKLLQLLGIKKENVWFKEWPRVFQASLSPVYYYTPAGKQKLSVSKDMSAADFKELVARIDELIDARQDRRALVHTSSYDFAQRIQAQSKWGRRMFINERGSASARHTAEQFRKASLPAALVSPSYGTGWDFPNDQLELNIIAKLPFVNRGDPVQKAREETDKTYGIYATTQDLVQACGRGSRHEEDRCETFILDGNIQWMQWAGKEHAPQWFKVIKIDRLPKAPPKM